MAKIIRDLWILTESGLTLFSRVIDPKMGPQVFGGLMIALNTYAESLTEGGISNFELSSIRFTIVKNNNFLFVASSPNDIKTKKVLNELKKISQKFFEVYPENILNNFSSNIRVFSEFKNHITDSLEEID
ncbi:MAG: hypothetical protein ACFFA4_13040 [Promethearchaeota archaeon]